MLPETQILLFRARAKHNVDNKTTGIIFNGQLSSAHKTESANPNGWRFLYWLSLPGTSTGWGWSLAVVDLCQQPGDHCLRNAQLLCLRHGKQGF